MGDDGIDEEEPGDDREGVSNDGPEELEDIAGVGASKADVLREAGFDDVAAVRRASESDLAAIHGFGAALAARVKADVGERTESGDAAESERPAGTEPDGDESDVGAGDGRATTTKPDAKDNSNRTEKTADANITDQGNIMGDNQRSTDDSSMDEPSTPSAGDGDERREFDTSLQLTEDRQNVMQADVVDGDSIGERLIDNIEGLRTTLEGASKDGGRVEAQIRQLQSEIGDLKAYKHAMEEFLEENGTGRQIITSVQDDIDSFEDDLDELRDVARNHATVLSDLRDSFSTVGARLENHEDSLEGIRDALDECSEEIGTVDDGVDELGDELSTLRERTDRRFDDHADDVDGLEAAVAENETAIEAATEDVDALATDLGALDDDIDEVRTDVDGVTDDLTELETDVEDRFAKQEEKRGALRADVESGREDLRADVAANDAAIEELKEQLNDVQSAVDRLEERLGETQSVDRRFDEIDEDIEQLRRWQEELRTVMGRPESGPGGQLE